LISRAKSTVKQVKFAVIVTTTDYQTFLAITKSTEIDFTLRTTIKPVITATLY